MLASKNKNLLIFGISMGLRYFLRSKDRNKFIIIGITLVQVLFLVVTANSLNFDREVSDLYLPLKGKLAIVEKGTTFIEGLPMSSYLNISIYERLRNDDMVKEAVAVYYERSGSSLQSNIFLGVSKPKKSWHDPFQYVTGIEIKEGRFPRLDTKEVAIGSETTYAKEGQLVGSKISIGEVKDVTITGFFEARHFLKDRFVLIPLWMLQAIMGVQDRINMIVIEPREGVSLQQLEDHVEKNYINVDALNEKERNELVREVLEIVNNFTFMIASVSFVAGTILVMSLTNLVLVHRFREMAVLKSMGSSNVALFLTVITENTCLQVVSYLMGVIISFLLLTTWTSLSLSEIKVTDILTPEVLIITFLVLFLSNVFGTVIGGRKPLQKSIIELMTS